MLISAIAALTYNTATGRNTGIILMPSVNRVEQALSALHCKSIIRFLDDSAHTASQAAQALGCDVAQIVKSLVFKTADSEQAILALVSGDKRLDINKLARVLDQPLKKADAEYVKSVTGFSIGGVAPVGSLTPLPVYMDVNLLAQASVWAAAGHPKAIFEIDPNLLLKITGARALDLACCV